MGNELFYVFVPMVKGEGFCPHEGVFPDLGKEYSLVSSWPRFRVEWDMEWGFCL